jgi:signal transduction histidine kinase/ligand-binding sensor domain-containing protein
LFRLFLYIAWVALLPSVLRAQPRQYIFTRLTVKEGLASNRVYSILQDKKGFMWMGTANGLQRFDGRKLIMFRPPADPGEYLPATAIYQIFEDAHNNFWVRSESEVGIFDPVTYRYKKAAIKTETEIPARSQLVLWQDSQGKIFLIITQREVLAYDSAANEFRKDTSKIKWPAGRGVNNLFEDRKTGNYWIGTDSGFAVYDVRTREVYSTHYNPRNLPLLSMPVFQNPITVSFIDQQNRFWVATWNVRTTGEQFYCYDLNSNRLLTDTSGLRPPERSYKELHGIRQQSNGRLWAYGLMMFLEYDAPRHRFNYIRDDHVDDYGIRYGEVYCLFEDNEENLWIGTDEGAYIFNPGREKFNSILTIQPDLKELSVTSFVEIPNRQTWVTTWGAGLISYDSNFVKVPNTVLKNVPQPSSPFFAQWTSWRHKKTGKIWIGCQEGRLIIHDPATGRSSFYILPVLENRTIRQITGDDEGNIWLGSQYGHLVKWNADAGYGQNFLSGFKLIHQFNTIIYRMRPDQQGNIWVTAHMKGVYTIDPHSGNITAYYDTKKGPGRSLYTNQVSDVLQYNDSLFFITAGVLHILNKNTGAIRQITAEEGLPSNNPTNLEMDADGNCWIGLLNGICRYNYRRNTFTQFSPKDGLIQENFYAGNRLRNGMMVFGNAHGFVYFQPRAVIDNSNPPLDVTITDFKLFNTYLPPDSIMKLDKVRLSHTQNSITIEFAALSFLQRDKIVYYYKLRGLNREWIRTDRLLFANYTLLPPGEYVFEVMCENADGIESKNITRLVIYIEPPFWRTWWFMSLVVIAITVLIYVIHRLRVNRLLGMEKVRTRIARDLHDDMGSTLSTINILSTMAKMKVHKDAVKTEEYLEKISDNSSRMMEAMDDIVWSINPMNDNMQKITARMREFATGVLEAKNIEFSFRVDPQVQELKLDMEARRDLFLLFKEAINNLAKYSQCKHAAIDISIVKHKLLMKIRDDGIGFDVNNTDGGNGLTNMQKRAQSLNGRLLIESEKQVGTQVKLEVPLT